MLDNMVTPCMGVWIEIYNNGWVLVYEPVTPCMGVWIEIYSTARRQMLTGVTPCMGVWIEISNNSLNLPYSASLPAWECGLKYIRPHAARC